MTSAEQRKIAFEALARELRKFDDGFDAAQHDGYTITLGRNRGGNFHVSVDIEIGDMVANSYVNAPAVDVAFTAALEGARTELAKLLSPIEYVPHDAVPADEPTPTGEKP